MRWNQPTIGDYPVEPTRRNVRDGGEDTLRQFLYPGHGLDLEKMVTDLAKRLDLLSAEELKLQRYHIRPAPASQGLQRHK